jgi:hypothetical protein
VAQGFGGYDQSADIQHSKAIQQRGFAGDHAAPPENARLADKFLWHTANFATEAVPWILGGIPGIGTRAAAKAAVSGAGKLAKRSFGAVPATVETTGATYDELLKKGFHPEQARELALEFGAGAGVANVLAYQFPMGPNQPFGEQLFTGGANQVIQEAGKEGVLRAMRQGFGIEDY